MESTMFMQSSEIDKLNIALASAISELSDSALQSKQLAETIEEQELKLSQSLDKELQLVEQNSVLQNELDIAKQVSE